MGADQRRVLRVKEPHWLWQFVTHPVLGPMVTGLLLGAIVVIVAVIAGVSSSNRWVSMFGIGWPALCVVWAALMAVARPAPKWRNGRWVKGTR